jgi:hypothetical protein
MFRVVVGGKGLTCIVFKRESTHITVQSRKVMQV